MSYLAASWAVVPAAHPARIGTHLGLPRAEAGAREGEEVRACSRSVLVGRYRDHGSSCCSVSLCRLSWENVAGRQDDTGELGYSTPVDVTPEVHRSALSKLVSDAQSNCYTNSNLGHHNIDTDIDLAVCQVQTTLQGIRCGRVRINPRNAICCQGVIYARSGRQPSCCGRVGYDALYYTCCGRAIIRRGTAMCSGSQRYDTSRRRCVEGYQVRRTSLGTTCCITPLGFRCCRAGGTCCSGSDSMQRIPGFQPACCAIRERREKARCCGEVTQRTLVLPGCCSDVSVKPVCCERAGALRCCSVIDGRCCPPAGRMTTTPRARTTYYTRRRPTYYPRTRPTYYPRMRPTYQTRTRPTFYRRTAPPTRWPIYTRRTQPPTTTTTTTTTTPRPTTTTTTTTTTTPTVPTIRYTYPPRRIHTGRGDIPLPIIIHGHDRTSRRPPPTTRRPATFFSHPMNPNPAGARTYGGEGSGEDTADETLPVRGRQPEVFPTDRGTGRWGDRTTDLRPGSNRPYTKPDQRPGDDKSNTANPYQPPDKQRHPDGKTIPVGFRTQTPYPSSRRHPDPWRPVNTRYPDSRRTDLTGWWWTRTTVGPSTDRRRPTVRQPYHRPTARPAATWVTRTTNCTRAATPPTRPSCCYLQPQRSCCITVRLWTNCCNATVTIRSRLLTPRPSKVIRWSRPAPHRTMLPPATTRHRSLLPASTNRLPQATTRAPLLPPRRTGSARTRKSCCPPEYRRTWCCTEERCRFCCTPRSHVNASEPLEYWFDCAADESLSYRTNATTESRFPPGTIVLLSCCAAQRRDRDQCCTTGYGRSGRRPKCCADWTDSPAAMTTPNRLRDTCFGRPYDIQEHLCCDGVLRTRIGPSTRCCGRLGYNSLLLKCCRDGRSP
ncbi:hypothetical protein NP493_971g00048 [Ridgeia piscesae]|uniref:Galaxin-like repeats domain-containing protein n=1 Tax=Ridgeia piscesae TaxID=27915 RepID=A0AAD9KIS2_RIDPI|nr:hypothetical protein NP493_971g00048 [Ridgeia piscesae]